MGVICVTSAGKIPLAQRPQVLCLLFPPVLPANQIFLPVTFPTLVACDANDCLSRHKRHPMEFASLERLIVG